MHLDSGPIPEEYAHISGSSVPSSSSRYQTTRCVILMMMSFAWQLIQGERRDVTCCVVYLLCEIPSLFQGRPTHLSRHLSKNFTPAFFVL
jgi:hypothetical protein